MSEQIAASPLERIRAKRAEQAAETTTEIPVAGYGGDLVVRYRMLDPLEDGKKIGARVLEAFPKLPDEQAYYILIDSMIEACVGIDVRGADGSLEPILPEKVVTFSDDRLAAALGVEASTARETVEGVFMGNRNAVVAHARVLQAWFSDPTGEFGATTPR